MTKIYTFFLVFVIFGNFSFTNIYASSDVSLFIKMKQEILVGYSTSVEITINKGDLRGLSKFEILAPLGSEVKVIDSKGASFIKTSNGGKLLWIDLPNMKSFTISYYIYLPKGSVGKQSINGAFYFLDRKISKSIFYHSTVVLSRPHNNYINDNNISLVILDRLIKEINTKDYIFSIQIGAYLSPLSNKIIIKRFINYDVKEEYNNKYYKYIIGEFNNLDDAIAFISTLPFKDAFVVPYCKGERVTVIEAVHGILGD